MQRAFFCILLLVGFVVSGCSSSEGTSSNKIYRCVNTYNACLCGDPAEIVLSGTAVNACPGSAPQGPFRCCKGSNQCRCEPYACFGSGTDICSCAYSTTGPRPTRCLTDAQKLAEHAIDPSAGDHCCATLTGERGQCDCSRLACTGNSTEVSLCSPETSGMGCAAGEIEVASCWP